MPYSASLAARVRQSIGHDRRVEEKRLFGGLGFLLRGHLLVAVWGTSLIARIGAEQATRLQNLPVVRPFDVTGKPMKGWVVIDAEGLDTDMQLAEWVALARAFVDTLPAR